MSRPVILFGGSFDPIHNGHLHMAKVALKELAGSRLWFVVAKDAPLKQAHHASFEHRVTMVQRAIAPFRKMSVCTVEQKLPTPSYTIDTVSYLKRKHPRTQFYFLIGDDQAAQLSKWKQINELSKQVIFLVYPRSGVDEFKVEANLRMLWLKGKRVDISSSDIRQGSGFQFPKAVGQYFIMHHLYDQSILKTHIKPKRLHHVNSVSDLAAKIAQKKRLNVHAVTVAACYHDVSKEWHPAILEAYMRRFAINQLSLPKPIWHAFVAKGFMNHYYGIYDKKILKAIEHHVQGLSQHNYAKIVYVSDKIEPTRPYDTSHLLALAFADLDQLFRIVKKEQRKYVQQEEK